MQTIFWEVECLSSVKVHRHCKKCGGKSEFAPSGLFRVNANKKRLDVWLVYRCAQCGTSWNLPIYERIQPNRLARNELEGFTQNDEALARRYAMDADLLARHGCEVSPPESIIHGGVPPTGSTIQVKLRSAVWLPVRIGKLLRQKLGLSAKQLEAMLASGAIRPMDKKGNLDKQKLGTGACIVVCMEAQDVEDTPASATRAVPTGAEQHHNRCIHFMRAQSRIWRIAEGAKQFKTHARRYPVFPAKMQLPYIRC